ncbi:MAG: biopolymer transporter ExbD [Spirochaetes bacterium]|nr:biopolymer transporter ExbD [Spirochaetota bacterium]
MNFQQFKRDNKQSFVLELTPLIDVVFLLLIFFMVSTTFSEQETGINIKLPGSNIKEVVETKEIIVSLTKDKEIYINSQKVSLNNFSRVLKNSLQYSRKDNVIIRGDKYVDYGFVVKIMTMSKNAGAKILDIATELEK